MNIYLDIDKLEEVASKLRAIAHPMRIAILHMLETEGEMNVTDIYERLKLEQATASHHLNILKTKKVLNSRREGKKTFYSPRVDNILQIAECISKC
jgi:ArsR family transcriptional regulator